MRSRDGDSVGVVLFVGDYSGDDSSKWELHVDLAVDGQPVGVGIVNPWDAIRDTSEAARVAVTRLGLGSS